MKATTNNYKTTFILDLRESKDDADKAISDLTELLGSLGATVSDSDSLGVREFARAADRSFARGHYIELYFNSTSTVPETLREKLRLDKRINRIFTQLEK